MLKEFDGKLFAGKVRIIRSPAEHGSEGQGTWHEVLYEDGDVEDYTAEELQPLLDTHAKRLFHSIGDSRMVALCVAGVLNATAVHVASKALNAVRELPLKDQGAQLAKWLMDVPAPVHC